MQAFFDLPAEVRSEIYELIFDTACVKWVQSLMRSGLQAAMCISPLLTCRQLLTEARPVFLRCARFDLSRLVGFLPCTFGPVFDPSLIRTIRLHTYSLVRKPKYGLGDFLNKLSGLTSLTFTGCPGYYMMPISSDPLDGVEMGDITIGTPEFLECSVINKECIKFITENPTRFVGREEDGRLDRGGAEAFAVLYARMVGSRKFKVYSEIEVYAECPTRLHSKGTYDFETGVIKIRKEYGQFQDVELKVDTSKSGFLTYM